MDFTLKKYKSLPPRVEGKIHGYVKLVVDQIIWSQKSPGNVSALACWWGESDSVQFSPRDVTQEFSDIGNQIEAFYAIKTSKSLFQEYIENCESLAIVIINKESCKLIGTAQVSNLLDIFTSKVFSRYFPVVDKDNRRMGDIHVAIRMLQNHDISKSRIAEIPERDIMKTQKDMFENDQFWDRNKKQEYTYNSVFENSESYKSFPKSPAKKSNSEITDILVSKVIARAQKLRRAMKVCQNDESFYDEFSENGMKYFPERDMNVKNDFKALQVLGSNSPLIGFEDLDRKHLSSVKPLLEVDHGRLNFIERCCTRFQNAAPESTPMDYVDSLRIFVECLTLNSAGYRRVKSSCLPHGDKIMPGITYFVQHDPILETFDDNKKMPKTNKPFKISSRKQLDKDIYFNHTAVYKIPKLCSKLTMPLKFKVFHRYLNQRSPTEFGTGSVSLSNVTASKNFTSTQRVVILNKGINVGELKVTIELGCDNVHFGQEFFDAMKCGKENIPVLDNPLSSGKGSVKYRTVTGAESGSSGNNSSSSSDKVGGISDLFSNRQKHSKIHNNPDSHLLRTQVVQNSNNDKVLLNGLIYIAEGKDLPESSTYLVCRTFWREDKARSQLCNNTTNPVYDFRQLVPIIYGADFLERTRENYIVTEVYGKNASGVENLLGIAKLTLHQLYISFRDPLVLQHLTLSKYPVISVDGWVSIMDPVSGALRGQMLALVAVGTPDQIAFLEMSRGLRNSTVSPRTMLDCRPLMASSSQEEDIFSRGSTRSQECQTDITLAEEMKRRKITDSKDRENCEDSSMEHLPREASSSKNFRDAQTDMSDTVLNLMPSRSQMLLSSDESSIECPGDNFPISSAMFRSVGVGAEFDDGTMNVPVAPSLPEQGFSSNDQSEVEDAEDDVGFFRALVEIKRAYHLPMMGPRNDVEPSTYVTFKTPKAPMRRNVTNVCLKSCSPSWDWKCETKLSRGLVYNKEKKLSLKVWMLRDPDQNLQIDVENDRLLGIVLLDLTVLAFDSPVLSGSFDITDLHNKVIGQIWVSITPLDNVSNVQKGNHSTNKPYQPTTHLTHTFNDVENRASTTAERVKDADSNFSEESISFLSQSFNKKLMELNEITMRLQSRLHDITDTAFDEDFDFDPLDSDAENDDKNDAPKQPDKPPVENNNELWLQPREIQTSAPVVQNHHPNNCGLRPKSDYSMSNGSSADQSYPARGTEVHINQLLNKLNCQLNSGPPQIPIQGTVMDLFNRLRQCDTLEINNTNNNNNNKRSCGGSAQMSGESEDPVQSQRRVKVSAMVREELAELDDEEHYDDLSAHLITANAQQARESRNFFNPFLYPHFIPDAQIEPAESPEDQSVRDLDSRYTESFNRSIEKRLRGPRDSEECEARSANDVVVDETVSVDSSGNSSQATVKEKEGEAESADCIVSRQAPDGGNPVEDAKSSSVAKKDDNGTP